MKRIIAANNAGSIQFRVSKPGADATSSNLDDFLIHESFGNAAPLAILNIASLPCVTAGSPSNSYSFYRYAYAHGLPFTPIIAPLSSLADVSGTVNGGATTLNGIYYTPRASGDQTANIVCAGVDATDVYFQLSATGYSGRQPSLSYPYVLTSAFLIAIFSASV